MASDAKEAAVHAFVQPIRRPMFGVIGQCVGFTDPAVDKKKLVLDVSMYQALHTLAASTSPVFELAAARHYVTISERSRSSWFAVLHHGSLFFMYI